MPQIDTKISNEVNEKYSVISNSFRLVKTPTAELDSKGTPKDLIVAEIGDVKQAEFYPALKLARWGDNEEVGEVNFSVRLKDTEYEKAKVSTLTDKIIWDKGNTKIEFYDYPEGEGGYKMVWFLKEKPLTNKVEFTIQSKSLDFFYQPFLTQEYQNGYSEEFQKEIVVSETQVKDLEGNVLVERPENVVGSYAVYHQTKGGMNDINGKEYKTGKAFHIYRPHIIDASGAETWGILHIENGIYSVEIPQNFLDKAVYPIKSNDTFGYTTKGGTERADGDSWFMGTKVAASGQSGTLNSITTFLKYNRSAGIIYGLYQSDGTKPTSKVGDTETWTITSGYNNWKTLNANGTPSLSNAETWLVILQSTYIYKYCDSASGYGALVYSTNPFSYPTLRDPSGITTIDNNTFRYSIYATYTPDAGGTNYTRSITESGAGAGIVLASSLTRNITAHRIFSEVVALTDFITKAKKSVMSVVGSISLADSISKATKFARTLQQETISLVETILISGINIFTLTLSETIRLADTISRTAKMARSFTSRIVLVPTIKIASSAITAVKEEIEGGIQFVKKYYGVLRVFTGRYWDKARIGVFIDRFWQEKPLYYFDGRNWQEIEK